MFNIWSVSRRDHLVTIHDPCQILDQAADHPEDLSYGDPSFIMRQSVHPLQNSLHSNGLPSENIPDRFDCDAISKVTRERERTHLTVPV